MASPSADLCIWPGCTRPRAPGRASGSGRQKEYCLQADPPEGGSGPVHNARNRWAALRSGAERHGNHGRAVSRDDGPAADNDVAPSDGEAAGESARVAAIPVPAPAPVTTAKKRASELLEQARRHHAAAL